jgi:hypothetical protein
MRYGGMTVHDESRGTWEEAVVTYFKALIAAQEQAGWLFVRPRKPEADDTQITV